MVVHDPGAGKYHLVDLSNGTIVFSIDFDRDISDELNARVGTWEVVYAELNVSKSRSAYKFLTFTTAAIYNMIN